jgi:hypothetical protein
MRQGAGLIDLPKADQPLIFARPVTVSFGFLRRGKTVSRRIGFTDAGGGAGEWSVSVVRQEASPGISVTAPARVSVPGTLAVTATARAAAAQRDLTGFLVFSRAGETRRLPFWLRVTAPRLARHPARALRSAGTYRGDTRGQRSLVSEYRYPEDPDGAGLARTLKGPEQVFRFRLRRPAENLGVAVLSSSRVQPRIVVGGDENRQAGPTALPLNTNPYLPTFFEPTPVAGVIRPAAGTYHVVFDSPTAAGAGRFRFRFWVGDTAPPRVRLLTPRARRGGALVVAASDGGAGVDPRSIFVRIDTGVFRAASYRAGRIRIPVTGLAPGRHRLTLQISDHQEAKNMENALRILPNTTVLNTAFSVR